ncbi:fructose-bisphosphatase class II family protein [Pseudonocardia sp. KRD291]|uniref:fructose-bisphosphatase class II family protein n=1 Tax=Pseudonocardia sp. KRD291 TaxID=2792007 RepID=UPI001C4A26CB|nr:fructose-bisphosphatase class II family protein [Pseudonocardia sp. KRD291]MBW0104707.1 fructose-bisphosphatase class II family protein [Pseudonocardia sp. KRD291]
MSTQEWFTTGVSREPDQALALELVRVTEAAAIAAGRWVGRGEPDSGRAAATVAMHEHLTSVPVRGTVVIGEGGQDDTPALRIGDDVGFGDGPECDLGIRVGHGALSPVKDVPNSLAVIAVAEPGALYVPPPAVVVEKLAVGSDCGDVVDITRPVAENLRAVAAVKGVRASDLVVAVLDRPRHRELMNEIRAAGARVHVLQGGDVAGAIAAARSESSVDVLLGTGGAEAGVIAAAALSCLGGSLQVRLRFAGVDKVLHTGDLLRGGRVLFCATGVTTSELLRGVQNRSGRISTESMVLCSKPDTVRMVRSEHRFA